MSLSHAGDHAAAHPRITGRVTWFVVLAALVAVAITFLIASPFDRTAGGEVAVVRNGGPFDNRQVRQIIDPASGLTYSGMFSESHKYPA